MGGYHNKGSQDRLPVRTSPESETSHSTILCGRESINSGGDKGTSGKRSHNRSAQPSGRVLLKPVPCPQKGWWTTPSNKPEGSEQFCSDRALQHGGNTYPQRPCQSGGLDDKGGSKGCVFHNPNPPVSPKIPEVQIPTQMLSIPVPTVWPVIGSLGLYQDPEANPSSPPGDWGAINSIHSQYPAPGGVPGASKEPCRGIGVPLAVPWVQGKLEKISIKPSPSDGIPGLYSRHSPNGVETPSGQNKKDSCRVMGHESGVSPRKSTGSAGGQDECNISGDSTSPSILSAPTVGPVCHTQSTLSVLRGTGSPDNVVQGGTDVVGHPHDKLEWKVPPQQGSGHDNRFRCLTHRLGSNQSGPQDWRSVVTDRVQDALQLSGAADCNNSSQDIPEKQKQDVSTPQVGRSHGSGHVPSRLTAQYPAYFTWRPDPYAVATDAFLQDWSQMKGYVNPPWGLIGRVLPKVQMDKAHIVLVAPVWKTQPWYPLLLQMLVAIPRLINHHQTMLNRGPEDFVPQLAVWHISGRDIETKSFRRKLLPSCSSHGELRPTSLTTHSLASGIAGVVQGVQIPFQAL